jgi:glycine cleavage system H lipoate-binding protein
MAPSDLFVTKGIEYLIVIVYLILLMGMWRLLKGKEPARAVARAAQQVGEWSVLPDGLCFHQGHSWAAPEEGDVVRVGIDAFAQRLLGRPATIKLPAVGTRLLQGGRGWEFRVGSNSVGMLSPVDGEVVAVNDAVERSPEILCSEPYGAGWLLKVRVTHPGRNQKHLFCGNLARIWMEEKLRAMQVGLGLVLPDRHASDGCDSFLQSAAPDGWDEVAEDLLLSRDRAQEVSDPNRWRVGSSTLPQEYCLHQGHSWVVLEDGNVVRVGMDDFSQRLLGRPDAIELPGPGTHLLQGERAWKIQVDSTSVGMLSPVEGEVVGVNYEVVRSPDILCSDPYGQGWLLKIHVPDHRRNQKNLLCGDLARTWMQEKLRTTRIELGLVLPHNYGKDGCDGFVRSVAPENWNEVASELLLSWD